VLTAANADASNGPRGPSGQPLRISDAALTQDGQQLTWSVKLEVPFSAAALARERRSLCVLIERASSGAVRGELCVIGPAHRRGSPRLAYMKIRGGRAGRAREVTATVSKTSPSSLVASFLPTAIGLRYERIRWQAISTLHTGACSSSSGSGACSALSDLFPAKPTLLRLHTPTLVGCVPSGPSLVYQGPWRERQIALTFDDGPWNDPPTSQFLAVLEREHVPATFFEIGDQISTYDPGGALERRMLTDGDMIGDHTWNHPVMTSLSASAQRAQLLGTVTAIKRATHGFTPCLWRPPYGAISRPLIALARSLGLLTIMWDIDPRDWALPGVGAIYSNVVGNAHNGAIVLQHFGGGPRFETLSALPEEISTLRARGYRFVTVAQLLGLKLVYR
jgi:peptidoglycan/xylan/chitin deacetylase (PgdA/CDA1 family)